MCPLKDDFVVPLSLHPTLSRSAFSPESVTRAFLFCNYHLLLLTSASNNTLEENTWGTVFSRRTWEIGDKKLCHNYSHHTLFCHKYVTTSKDYYTKVCYDDNKKAVISEGALQLEQSRESCKSPLISFSPSMKCLSQKSSQGTFMRVPSQSILFFPITKVRSKHQVTYLKKYALNLHQNYVK